MLEGADVESKLTNPLSTGSLELNPQVGDAHVTSLISSPRSSTIIAVRVPEVSRPIVVDRLF